MMKQRLRGLGMIIVLWLSTFLLLVRQTTCCPHAAHASGLDGTAYTCSASDAGDCQVTSGTLSALTGVFSTPERTGVALAVAERLSFKVKCASVTNGITGSGTLEAKVLGCFGGPSFSVEGTGSIVVTGTDDATACPATDCTCSWSGSAWVGSHTATWNHDGDATYDHDSNATTPEIPTEFVTCTCTCTQYTCQSTLSSDGKTKTISAGNDAEGAHTIKTPGSCTVSATCPGGYLDGQTYTSYDKSIGVTLKDAGGVDRSGHLGGASPSSVSNGVYTFANLRVDGLAIHNNELTVTFTATGTPVTAERGSFKLYPTSFRVVQATSGYPGTVPGNPQYMNSAVYTVGEDHAALGYYAIQFIDVDGAVIPTIDAGTDVQKKPNDIFNATVKVITGKNSNAPLAWPINERQDSTSTPSTNSRTTLDKSDLLVNVTGHLYSSNVEWGATYGTLAGHFTKVDEEYVKVNDDAATGSMTYAFECTAETNVTFSVNVIAETGDKDSVFLSIDGGTSNVWNLCDGACAHQTWTWSALDSPTFVRVASGSHALAVTRRENGLKLRTIKFVTGANLCKFVGYIDASESIASNDVVSMNSNLAGIHSMRFRLNLANQVGTNYKLAITTTVSQSVGSTTLLETIVGSSTGGNSFRVNAGAIYAAYGSSKTMFSQKFFPRIIKADTDGAPEWDDLHSGTANSSGIPSPLHILFRNTGGSILQHSNCYQCVQARLLMCLDRLTAKAGYPLCSSVSQAVCATSSTDGSKCGHSSSSGVPVWVDTLGGTTVVNLINGTATFTDLKVQYVFGAGYRLQFMLNANGRSTTVYNPNTVFSSGSVMLPDPSYSSAPDPTYNLGGVNNSFYVLPHHLDVYQQVGGDGVDLNKDDVPDGVGVGIPFRVQPAVVVMGDGYAFNKAWNTHGWAPVTATIKEKSCTVAADAKNCELRHVSLYGRITKPVWYASKFTATELQPAMQPLFSDKAYYWKATGNCEFPVTSVSECVAANIALGTIYKAPQGTVSTTLDDVEYPPYCFIIEAENHRKLVWNTKTSGPTVYTHAHSTLPSKTLCKVHQNNNDERNTVNMYYSSILGHVGMLWQDLRVYTTNQSAVWQGDIRLEFRLGPAKTEADDFVAVLGNPFDAFLAPDPPTNLRVTSYDDLGFRVEFEPSVVSRAQPLSGFIIEVDVCSNSTSSNASCSTSQHPAYKGDLRYTMTSALGTDLSAGGGMSVDVLLNFTNPTPGQVSPVDISFKPPLTIYAGDSIALNLGRTFRMLSNFDAACQLEGSDGNQFTITNFNKHDMVFYLLVNKGSLTATKPVYATFPASCGITIPGDAANEAERSRFGIFVNPLPSILHAPILGAVTSRRFDNCKGTGPNLNSFDGASGCDVTATYVLSTLQDASSMDTDWGGPLQFGGTSVECADAPLPLVKTPFPSNRVCATYSAESKCKDLLGVYSDGVCCEASCLSCGGSGCENRTGGANGCCAANIVAECSDTQKAPCKMTSSTWYDTTTMQNAGDNGKPIGSNPGSGSSTGSASSDSDEACRSGGGVKNPCALSVGQDWTLGVNTSYSWRSHLRPNETIFPPSYPRIGATFIRDRALAFRDVIEIRMPGLVNRQPQGGMCHVFAEKGARYGHGISPGKNSTATTQGNFTSTSACETFMTEVYLNHTDKPTHAWESYWDDKRSIMSIVVGTPVAFESKVEIFIHGFQSTVAVGAGKATVDCAEGTIKCQSSMEVIADVKRGRKTSVLFKNLATKSAYVTKWGQPLQNYAETKTTATTTGLVIHASAIYSFRVYAYNGRYKSKSVQTLVQNRAIQRPEKPLYFPQVSQESVAVQTIFTNLAGQQTSSPQPGVASPIQAQAGSATRIGVKFTPTRQINELETLDLHLPRFTGPGFLAISNDASNLILRNRYQPYGSTGCQCDEAGRVLTPRNNYKVVRAAFGNGSCAHTETNYTQRITGIQPPNTNISTPWCACGDCECTLDGRPIEPAPLFNVTGDCTDPHPDGVCACDASGQAITPPVTYNSSGNCSSCTCDSNGRPSHISQFKVVAKLGQSDSLIAAGGTCSNCTCDSQGVISAQSGNCTQCMCQVQGCACQCTPRICSCKCPVFRKCTCNCELFRTHNCGCQQNEPDDIFQNASWSSFTEALVLTVGPKKQLPANKEAMVWISAGAGIKMPDDGSYPTRDDGISGLEAFFMKFNLNWISQFPSSATPRLGFIIQFTSDLFWKTNVQTVVVPDVLDQGVVSKETVAILGEQTSLEGEVIKLSSPARFLNGRYIQIESEVMKVLYANSTHPLLTVKRGEFSTSRVIHDIASGGANCGCSSNGTTLGGNACKCNGVQIINMGATDFGIGGGLDFKTGYQGVNCRPGSDFVDEGCNVQGHVFPYNIRTHQSAIISGRVTPSSNFATACSGTASTCTSGNCVCESPSLVFGGEFGNQRPRGNTSIVSPGNVMDFPVDFRTRLATPCEASGDITILAVHDTDQLIGKYIRLGDEIMFAKDKSRGVLSVSTFRAFGGMQCSCSITGVASGGSMCICLGNQGSNCTAGGSLQAIGGGGQEFKGRFTVSHGKVDSITVTSPGFGYMSAPEIKILTGGDLCLNVEFYPILTDKALRVARAQLGTTVAAHLDNAIVNTVLWPSQRDARRPGRRYNFRIAAYNTAGFSNFAYFETKLYSVTPRVLPAAGGTSIEILLVGGGVVAKGYKVYIGRLKTDGSVDLSRSKECGALVNLDLAGTRLRCKAPAWVGGQFDLILHYKSGIYEQIATGNSWIKYEAPIITGIMPALLDPAVSKVPVVVTVSGKNFGLDSRDLIGELQGATVIPCRPLVVITDGMLECTLTPQSTDEKLVGDIVITAGNETFHGKGQSTKAGATSAVGEKPQPVKVEATIQASFDEVTSSPTKTAEFKATFTNDIAKAAAISPALINVTDIKAGSVIVVFSILPDPSSSAAPSPASVALNLAVQAADPNSVLRQGSLTSSVSVALPAGVEDLASTRTSTAAAGSVPKYFSACEPKSYNPGLDMKRCYNCCTYLCQTGPEVPQNGGMDVLPGFRAMWLCEGKNWVTRISKRLGYIVT